jgi:hypothetical protein
VFLHLLEILVSGRQVYNCKLNIWCYANATCCDVSGAVKEEAEQDSQVESNWWYPANEVHFLHTLSFLLCSPSLKQPAHKFSDVYKFVSSDSVKQRDIILVCDPINVNIEFRRLVEAIIWTFHRGECWYRCRGRSRAGRSSYPGIILSTRTQEEKSTRSPCSAAKCCGTLVP